MSARGGADQGTVVRAAQHHHTSTPAAAAVVAAYSRQHAAVAPVKAAPEPAPIATGTGSQRFERYDSPIDTWTLKGRQVRKVQTEKFAKPDAEDGQLGSTSTWLGRMGVPLTFHDKDGNDMTVFALKKPLMLAYEEPTSRTSKTPIKITRDMDGHGKELGIEVGWTLAGIGYKDITDMPFDDADKLLHEKVNSLPGAIPMKWVRNNSEIKIVYAYHHPLGLSFESKLPIIITSEKAGHGQDIGIKVGWKLLEINYHDVSNKTDFAEVMQMLKDEIQVLPPVAQ